jgi:hypothetical protein
LDLGPWVETWKYIFYNLDQKYVRQRVHNSLPRAIETLDRKKLFVCLTAKQGRNVLNLKTTQARYAKKNVMKHKEKHEVKQLRKSENMFKNSSPDWPRTLGISGHVEVKYRLGARCDRAKKYYLEVASEEFLGEMEWKEEEMYHSSEVRSLLIWLRCST